MKTSILITAVLAALGIAASSSAATRSESAALAAQPQVFSIQLAKHGADDAVDGADDNGVDVIIAKHGADDLVDGEDDHGIDFILG